MEQKQKYESGIGIQGVRQYFNCNKVYLTPSIAWLSISSRPPDESYRGVAVSVGGLGTAKEGN